MSERKFETGATRDVEDGKLDFDGFLSPLVLHAFAEFMHINRTTVSGVRDSDNWQRGIPMPVYRKSLWRHFFAWWASERGLNTKDDPVIEACAIIFNISGWLHEYLKANPGALDAAIEHGTAARAAENARRAGIKISKAVTTALAVGDPDDAIVEGYGCVGKYEDQNARTGPVADYLAEDKHARDYVEGASYRDPFSRLLNEG
jgi:hypothetical protein